MFSFDLTAFKEVLNLQFLSFKYSTLLYFRLLQQLLEVQRAYNDLLKKTITEKKIHMEFIQ